MRHKQHFQSSKHYAQPINRILQQNPNRYTYQVLVWNVDSQERLNALEIQYIRQLKPKFNFTDGGDGSSGFKHSEKTRKKMSENNKGENNPMYGKKHSEETKKKISESASEAQNTTGFYRVSKQKDNAYKQGFIWRYYYRNENNKLKKISSTDLKKLEQKVLLNNLEWKIINEEYAKQSLREDRI